MAHSVYRHSPLRTWAARHRWLVRAAVALVVAAVAAGVTLSVTGHGPSSRARRGSGPATVGSGPFAVTSVAPGAGAHVPSDAPVVVHTTHPVDLSGPMPSFDPPVAGRWRHASDGSLTFEATAPFVPGTKETLSVPGGPAGLRDDAHRTIMQAVNATFTVDSSTLRLQQLLATLGYLPESFTATGPPPAPKEVAQPQPGTFAWRWSDSLSGLQDHWGAGEFGVLTQAAVMTFQDQHHLTVDGVPGPKLWSALLSAAAAGEHDPQPYDYVFVDKDAPEHLTLYVDGVAKFPDVAVNTGLHGADTPDGTYAVFEHVPASEMKGTNPDGTTYDDPNVPWASYFYQGDALHGFVRATYGSPQSNGCVEMSIADAGALWPYTPIGTLVTVTGPAS